MKHEQAFEGRKEEEPAGLSSEEELEFYEELYPFLPKPVTEKEEE